MDKWVPTTCMILSAVLASAAYFLWTTQMSSASDIITVKATTEAQDFSLNQSFFEEINIEDANVAEDKIKILLVPGHDKESYGADYGNLTEQEINLELATKLHKKLSEEQKFEVTIIRNSEKYTEQFSEYFEKNEQEIISFINNHKNQTSELIKSGLFEPVRVVDHNKASKDVAVELYGINKWVNENEIDLVVHIHFNDYPRKDYSIAGKYNGFSIYIPSNNLTGNEMAKTLAQTLRKNLSKYFSESNLPVEKNIVIENSELIAVGSNNTLDTAVSLLIEYGYIYEDQFYNKDKRPDTLEKAAEQTYLAIKDLF